MDIDDDDIDISAIYVLGDKKIDLGSREGREIINNALQEAARELRRKYKEAGVPMVIERNGKVVYLQPDEIDID